MKQDAHFVRSGTYRRRLRCKSRKLLRCTKITLLMAKVNFYSILLLALLSLSNGRYSNFYSSIDTNL